MQGNQEMRARIAGQTISKEDVLRMNAERWAPCTFCQLSPPSPSLACHLPKCMRLAESGCVRRAVTEGQLHGLQGEAGRQAGSSHERQGERRQRSRGARDGLRAPAGPSRQRSAGLAAHALTSLFPLISAASAIISLLVYVLTEDAHYNDIILSTV